MRLLALEKLEVPSYEDACDCEYCTLELGPFESETFPLNVHAW